MKRNLCNRENLDRMEETMDLGIKKCWFITCSPFAKWSVNYNSTEVIILYFLISQTVPRKRLYIWYLPQNGSKVRFSKLLEF